jgi:stage II sporulation protein R
VIIGKGEGQNWWCVMFPPMCITAADETEELSSVLKENEVKLVEKNPVFEPRFKIIEIFEKLKNRFSDY